MSAFELERARDGVSKKWEFIYTDDYAKDGIKIYLKEGSPYMIRYYKDKTESYVDQKGRSLIRFKNLTLYSKYSNAMGFLTREVYVKPHRINVTDKMRKSGFINRYFVKNILDEENNIFEVSKQDFNKKTNLYKKISLIWTITGPPRGVSRKNTITLLVKDFEFKGIKGFLDPLEFYKGEVSPKNVKKERIRKLIKQDKSKFTTGTSKGSFKSKGSKSTFTTTTSTSGKTGY